MNIYGDSKWGQQMSRQAAIDKAMCKPGYTWNEAIQRCLPAYAPDDSDDNGENKPKKPDNSQKTQGRNGVRGERGPRESDARRAKRGQRSFET